jgi:hypothetical protein
MAQSGTDVIYLKNGTVVRGKIVDQVPNVSIKVYTVNRTMVEFRMDEVERMAKEAPQTTDLTSTDSGTPTAAGNIIIGGDVTADYYKESSNIPFSTPYKRTYIAINPVADYFISDNLAVGASATLSFSFHNNLTTTNFGIGPEVRYYFDYGLLLKLQTAINRQSNKNYKDTYFTIKPGVGYAIFLNQKVALEPCIVYELGREKYTPTPGTETKYKSGRFGLEIGLTIFL